MTRTKTSHHPRTGHALFSWKAPEYIQHEKSLGWYAAAGIIVLILLAWAIYTANWTFAAAITVLTTVYFYLHRYHPPKLIKISITELGIHAGHKFFPFNHIQSFWIIYKHDWHTINLRINNGYFYDLVIHLEDQDPVAIREYLLGQIPEWEGKDESFSDYMQRLLKF